VHFTDQNKNLSTEVPQSVSTNFVKRTNKYVVSYNVNRDDQVFFASQQKAFWIVRRTIAIDKHPSQHPLSNR